MNPLLPILLVVILVAGEDFAPSAQPGAALIALGGPVAIVILVAALLAWARGRFERGGLRTAARIVGVARPMIVGVYAIACLGFGWIHVVRGAVGDGILFDEFAALAPPLFALAALPWLYYPLARRRYESAQIRSFDEGGPVWAMPSRFTYVALELRTGLLLPLVPLALILALHEIARMWLLPGDAPALDGLVSIGIVIVVFLTAPLLLPFVLDLVPMRGEGRDWLDGLCAQHGIRVRNIFVWRTHGAMVNAAATGLLAPVRYVLLSDALLDAMSAEQIESVMAHELGHLRRRHLPWFGISLAAAVLAPGVVLAFPLAWIEAQGVTLPESLVRPVEFVLSGVVLGVALVAFGCVTRQFERQADTFSVQHLSGLGRPEAPETGPRLVTARAVAVATSALEAVARLNHIDRRRRSWWHGSIASRVAYLKSLAGQPVDALPIDRIVRKIKWGAAVTLAASILAITLLDL